MSVVPEGAGLRQGLRFGEVAEIYDRRRPDYPEALIADVVASVPPPASVLEVGAGTGKATSLLVAAGATVTAVEPDPAMAERLRRHRLSGVTVRAGTLEALATEPEVPRAPDGEGFALVTAAQAWHWVDHRRGPELARRLLRPDGVLAVFWNTPRGGPDYGALTDVYRRHAPHMVDGMDPAAWEAEMAQRRVHLAEADGFEAPETLTYDWEAEYGPEALAELVQTYSGHRLLEPDQLDALTAAVAAMVEGRSGSVTLGYRSVLFLVRRRG